MRQRLDRILKNIERIVRWHTFDYHLLLEELEAALRRWRFSGRLGRHSRHGEEVPADGGEVETSEGPAGGSAVDTSEVPAGGSTVDTSEVPAGGGAVEGGIGAVAVAAGRAVVRTVSPRARSHHLMKACTTRRTCGPDQA